MLLSMKNFKYKGNLGIIKRNLKKLLTFGVFYDIIPFT